MKELKCNYSKEVGLDLNPFYPLCHPEVVQFIGEVKKVTGN